MKNRFYSLLVGLGLLSGTAYGQPPRIVVQGAGAPQVFTTINAALAAAQPNDKVYLSGGTIISATQLVIDKPLHWIGAGINPTTTAVTGTTTLQTTSGDIVITTAASGSTFTGITFTSGGSQVYYGLTAADDDPQNMVFERCRFTSETVLGRDGVLGSSTTFEDCIFNHHIYGSDAGGTFNRCIFDYQSGTSSAVNSFSPLTISHCVFLNVQAFRNSGSAYMENSICTSTTSSIVYQSGGSTITNCIFSSLSVIGNSTGIIFTNNQIGVPAADIFVNELDGDHQFTDDLHMAVGSPGIGAANDATDAGIYGSGTPFKVGNLPFNAHAASAVIGASTNANSELPVNITVIAQPN
ncbi:MAG TPA: hypothetical protein PK760_06885 [Flavobacteriales bacterium]|nr:hypothetical protein [Flavobacteriales bacterium]